MEDAEVPKEKRKPGRKSIPGTERYNVVLEQSVAGWAMNTPEGLSGMIRRLLAQEKARQERAASKTEAQE